MEGSVKLEYSIWRFCLSFFFWLFVIVWRLISFGDGGIGDRGSRFCFSKFLVLIRVKFYRRV